MDNKRTTTSIPPGEYNLKGINAPSLKRRSASFLIDILIMFFIAALVFIAASLVMVKLYVMKGVLTMAALFWFILIPLSFLTAFSYFPLFEYFNQGKTIGRKITGIQLVTYFQEDNKITIKNDRIGPIKLALRNLFKLIWYSPPLIIFLVIASLLTHQEKFVLINPLKLICFIVLPIIIFPVIAFTFMYRDKLKRAFYDKVLKTLVIHDKY